MRQQQSVGIAQYDNIIYMLLCEVVVTLQVWDNTNERNKTLQIQSFCTIYLTIFRIIREEVAGIESCIYL